MISIIVPVYNAEKHLSKCISDVLNQTYENWELVLVNDGSNDESANVAEAYSQQDRRIKIFHTENGGVSTARNLGLERSSGEYICFMDSDDSIGKDYLSNLVSEMKQDIDLVIFPINRVGQKGNTIETIRSYDQAFFASDSASLFQHLNVVQYGYCFSALYRKKIIAENNVIFPEKIDKCEDLIFVLKYILHSKKIRSSDKSDYFYNIGITDSLSKKKQSIYTAINLIKTLYKILRFDFKIDDVTKYPNLTKALYFNFQKGLASLLDEKYSDSQIIQNLDAIKNEEYSFFISNQSPTLKAKILEWFLIHKMLRVYLLLVKIKRS